jgi:AcrR family transcriptional regulator
MPNLTERRHQQTREAIADAAVALFRERGYDATTMEEVAVAAGVSRRTAYRHFPNKDDLVFENPRRWLVHFNATIAVRERGETMHQLCRRGVLAVAALIEADGASVLAAFSVYAATPGLRGRNGHTEDEWYARYVELLMPAGRVGHVRRLQVATIAAALVGATKMLVAEWAAAQPGADMVSMTTAVLDQLEPIWPVWLDR